MIDLFSRIAFPTAMVAWFAFRLERRLDRMNLNLLKLTVAIREVSRELDVTPPELNGNGNGNGEDDSK